MTLFSRRILLPAKSSDLWPSDHHAPQAKFWAALMMKLSSAVRLFLVLSILIGGSCHKFSLYSKVIDRGGSIAFNELENAATAEEGHLEEEFICNRNQDR